MKKRFSKYFSVIISITLLCTSLLLPVGVTAVDDSDTAGAAIAGGDWWCSVVDFNNPSGPYWTGSGYDCYPQGANSITINQNYALTPYAIYTKLSGLDKNTAYEITFEYDVSGGLDASNSGVILNKDNTYASIKWQDNRICKVNNTVYGLATDDTVSQKATISFTTDNNTEYFLSLKANSLSTSITFKNFTVKKELAGGDPAGVALAGGIWWNSAVDCSEPGDNNGWTGASDSVYTQGYNSITVTEGYYTNFSLYTKLSNLEQNTVYKITFQYDVEDGFDAVYSGVVRNENSSGPYWDGGKNNIWWEKNTVYAKATDNDETNTATVTFTTDQNSEYYFIVKSKVLSSAITFSNFTVSATPSSPGEITGDLGAAVAKGVWWCSVVDCFNYSQSDVFFTGSGYGYYPQGNNSITVNQDVTPWAIYTKLSGLEKNTAYQINFDYDVAGGLDASNSGVILNEGTVPVWLDNRIDKVDNKVFGIAADDAENKKASIYFVTDEHSDYFLSLKTNYMNTPVTFSNFTITASPIDLTDAEKWGAKVVSGEWSARYYSKVDSKNITTRTITARDTNYHWVIGVIDDLTVGKTYKFSFKDDYGSVSSIYSLPANENAIGLNDSVINYNGSYTGLYRNNMANYSSTVVNKEEGIVSLLFTATATKVHIFISHAEATTASYSGITFEEFKDITFEGASLRDGQNLCFTFDISQSLQNEYNGKRVVEYGVITAVTDDLRDEPLVWNTMEAVGMARVKKVVAYNAADGTNNIYSENDDGSKTFTAVISGVSQNHNKTDISARPYFLLEDGTMVYGSTECSSVDKNR